MERRRQLLATGTAVLVAVVLAVGSTAALTKGPEHRTLVRVAGGVTSSAPSTTAREASSIAPPASPPSTERATRASTTLDVTTYPISSNTMGGGITAGPDGNLWFTTDSAIGRITPRGAVRMFPLPSPLTTSTTTTSTSTTTTTVAGATTTPPQVCSCPPGPGSFVAEHLMGITAGPDGALWFTTIWGDRIGRMTTNGAVTSFEADAQQAITTGPGSTLWFASSKGIGRMTTSGAASYFATATPPNGLVGGSGGDLWFGQQNGTVGRIRPSGSISYVNIPPHGAQPPSSVKVGAVDRLGDVWFLDADGLGRITPSGSVAVFPALQFGDAFANGPDGNLWVLKESTVARVLPDGTATMLNLRMPQGDLHGPVAGALTTGPDRSLWMYGYYAGSYVGRFTPPS